MGIRSVSGRAAFILMVAFYLFAGYNHFANPGFYEPVIPPWLSEWTREINVVSGIAEIMLGLLLIPKATRKAASWGIVLMLIAFIPSHVYFIQKGVFQLGPFTITPTFAWIRLLLIHPMLMLWALWAGRYEGI
jgi:uncharacterized membrane protein